LPNIIGNNWQWNTYLLSTAVSAVSIQFRLADIMQIKIWPPSTRWNMKLHCA